MVDEVSLAQFTVFEMSNISAGLDRGQVLTAKSKVVSVSHGDLQESGNSVFLRL